MNVLGYSDFNNTDQKVVTSDKVITNELKTSKIFVNDIEQDNSPGMSASQTVSAFGSPVTITNGQTQNLIHFDAYLNPIQIVQNMSFYGTSGVLIEADGNYTISGKIIYKPVSGIQGTIFCTLQKSGAVILDNDYQHMTSDNYHTAILSNTTNLVDGDYIEMTIQSTNISLINLHYYRMDIFKHHINK